MLKVLADGTLLLNIYRSPTLDTPDTTWYGVLLFPPLPPPPAPPFIPSEVAEPAEILEPLVSPQGHLIHRPVPVRLDPVEIQKRWDAFIQKRNLKIRTIFLPTPSPMLRWYAGIRIIVEFRNNRDPMYPVRPKNCERKR